MPNGKKKVNWIAIQKRWLQDESSESIAQDYEGLTGNAIRVRASKQKWQKQKDTIRNNIVSDVEDDLKALCNVTLRVHKAFMEKLEGQLEQISNPYLLDGERTNSLYQTAMNNSFKVMIAAIKNQETEPDEEPAGFEVSLDAGG